jgi:hypothetical protein
MRNLTFACLLLVLGWSTSARADGRGLEIAGATLTAVGGATFVGGTGLMASELNARGCGCGGLPLVWLTLMPLGGALMIAGVPMLIVGYRRAHRAPGKLALAPNGFTLRF